MQPLTISKQNNSNLQGVIFSPKILRGKYQRIEYQGLIGCSKQKTEEHLNWMCGLVGADLSAGQFSLSRRDAHKTGRSAKQFLEESIGKIHRHDEWSEAQHERCIGSWIHFPESKSAPRIRAISLLGEPHEVERMEDFRINIIVSPGARPEKIDTPESIESQLERPVEWNPSRIVIYPPETTHQEPIKIRDTTDGHQILLDNPFQSVDEGSIYHSNASDRERSAALDRLNGCSALQTTAKERQVSYRIKRVELVSFSDLSTSGHCTWGITPVVE